MATENPTARAMILNTWHLAHGALNKLRDLDKNELGRLRDYENHG